MSLPWTVEVYKTAQGDCPLAHFLAALPAKDRGKMIRAIEMLETYGIGLKFPHAESLGEGLYELRSQVGNNIQRVIYFHYRQGTFILLKGFTKKTQRTPSNQLRQAKHYRDDYLNRQNEKDS